MKDLLSLCQKPSEYIEEAEAMIRRAESEIEQQILRDRTQSRYVVSYKGPYGSYKKINDALNTMRSKTQLTIVYQAGYKSRGMLNPIDEAEHEKDTLTFTLLVNHA